MTGRVGVAISTTGEPHRLDLLRQSVAAWDRCLPDTSALFVTVDGSAAEAETVRQAVYDWTGAVFRVGPRTARINGGPLKELNIRHMDGSPVRLGVAANKNTGIELLMENGNDIEHLFLSDDDTWPLYPESITKHINLNMAHDVRHSMVCWGRHRLDSALTHGAYQRWTWPRGSMMYVRRNVVEAVGGMDERFGPGGHEHVEWSQRIHNAGLTPAPFCSPFSYGTRSGMGAAALWHAEDMPRVGEKLGDHRLRRRQLTTIHREGMEWDHTNRIMAECQGRSDFVDYHAAAWGRGSATLCENTPSRGAGEE